MLDGKMSGNFASQACMLAFLTNKNPIFRKKYEWVYRVSGTELCRRLERHGLTNQF
jgi:hypothetical protein